LRADVGEQGGRRKYESGWPLVVAKKVKVLNLVVSIWYKDVKKWDLVQGCYLGCTEWNNS